MLVYQISSLYPFQLNFFEKSMDFTVLIQVAAEAQTCPDWDGAKVPRWPRVRLGGLRGATGGGRFFWKKPMSIWQCVKTLYPW